MYWRTRLTAFLVGFGIAGGFAMFQIRNDIAQSHRILQSQSQTFGSTIEKKIEQLEAEVARLKQLIGTES